MNKELILSHPIFAYVKRGRKVASKNDEAETSSALCSLGYELPYMGPVYVNGDERDDTRNNATHLKYFLKLT